MTINNPIPELPALGAARAIAVDLVESIMESQLVEPWVDDWIEDAQARAGLDLDSPSENDQQVMDASQTLIIANSMLIMANLLRLEGKRLLAEGRDEMRRDR